MSFFFIYNRRPSVVLVLRIHSLERKKKKERGMLVSSIPGGSRRGAGINFLINTAAAAVYFFLTLQSASASNPFSSNVVALTSSNWNEVVVNSPHAVLVNICRVG